MYDVLVEGRTITVRRTFDPSEGSQQKFNVCCRTSSCFVPSSLAAAVQYKPQIKRDITASKAPPEGVSKERNGSCDWSCSIPQRDGCLAAGKGPLSLFVIAVCSVCCHRFFLFNSWSGVFNRTNTQQIKAAAAPSAEDLMQAVSSLSEALAMVDAHVRVVLAHLFSCVT